MTSLPEHVRNLVAEIETEIGDLGDGRSGGERAAPISGS